MNDKVTGVNNFSGCCDWNIWINFEDLVHGFSHYLDIPFYTSSEKDIIAKCCILFWPIDHKRFNLQNRRKNIRQIFL